MIYLGCDHGGFQLKEKVKGWLHEWQMPFEDLGAIVLDPNDDYPDYAFAVAQKVVEDVQNRGILLCRSSGGMVIAANRIKGVRAVSVYDEKSAVHARHHNDANIIGISGDWTGENEAKELVHVFLSTPFSHGERHIRRIQKLDSLGI
ncbi:MAG TPA: RpiB/LacA/LacB family sugar-phosphate isomerase [Patescibacteria group bacterium]|nr:RpiB/LacA/LacB family sugar-phosphate isomerase [Patescibacteria group bacterium]